MTPTKTKARTALDQLAERQEAVEDAKARLAELEAEGRTSKRDLDRAVVPLQDYYRSLEAGERKPDADLEAELREAVDKAQASVAPQAVYNQRAGIGEAFQVELVNPQVEGKLAGARQKLADAERELDIFLRSRFDDLAVELGALGTKLAERYAPLAEEASKAQDEWIALRNRWRPLIEIGSFDWADFPRPPFAEIDVRPLMPRQLASGEPVTGPSAPKRRKRG